MFRLLIRYLYDWHPEKQDKVQEAKIEQFLELVDTYAIEHTWRYTLSDFNTHESTFNTVKWSRFQVGYIILEIRMYLQSSLAHLHSVCVDLLSVTCTYMYDDTYIQTHAFTVSCIYSEAMVLGN